MNPNDGTYVAGQAAVDGYFVFCAGAQDPDPTVPDFVKDAEVYFQNSPAASNLPGVEPIFNLQGMHPISGIPHEHECDWTGPALGHGEVPPNLPYRPALPGGFATPPCTPHPLFPTHAWRGSVRLGSMP